jgi:hypothetical protein
MRSTREWPASGAFSRSQEGGLKLILKDRFADWKNTQERNYAGTQPDWTDQLILNKNGTVKAILANVVLILRKTQNGKTSLAMTSSTHAL